MTLNGVIALILRFSPNSIALLASYVTVVEDRPIVCVNIVSQFQYFTFGHNYPSRVSVTRQRHASASRVSVEFSDVRCEIFSCRQRSRQHRRSLLSATKAVTRICFREVVFFRPVLLTVSPLFPSKWPLKSSQGIWGSAVSFPSRRERQPRPQTHSWWIWSSAQRTCLWLQMYLLNEI